MKNKILMTSIITSLLLFPPIINADCTKEEIQKFKEIENEYKVTYEFNKESKNYTLIFNYPKPEEDIYSIVPYIGNEIKCEEISNTQEKCYNIESGEYLFEIYGNTETCRDLIKNFTIKLPKYNKLSEDPLCNGIEEFVLCQPTYDKEIDYDSFVSRINTYKNTQKNTKSEEKKQKDNDVIFEYIENNFLKIALISVFTIAVIITIILTIKSIKKSRRLE